MVVRMAVLVLVAVAVGCGPKASPPVAPQPDPSMALYEQVRAGSFQLTAAATSLEASLEAVRAIQSTSPKQGELAETLLDVEDYLQSCGKTIAEFTDEPPALEVFRADIPTRRTQLAQARKAAEDAFAELGEAAGIVEGLLEDPPKGTQPGLARLDDAMAQAGDDLAAAIEAMGGSAPTSGS